MSKIFAARGRARGRGFAIGGPDSEVLKQLARKRTNTANCRARQKGDNPIAIAHMPYSYDDLNGLIDIGLLGENESADHDAVVRAIRDALHDYIRAQRLRRRGRL